MILAPIDQTALRKRPKDATREHGLELRAAGLTFSKIAATWNITSQRVIQIIYPKPQRSRVPYRNPEKEKARLHASYIVHQEQVKKRTALYRITHVAQYQGYKRRPGYYAWYRTTHKAARAVYRARRWALQRGLLATLTPPQWAAILRAYKMRCAYCGKKKASLTQDHVVPLARGGGTIPHNIVPACLPCNVKKGTRPPNILPALRLLI